MRDKCKTCIYRAPDNMCWKCEYILIVGKRRPCEPGNLCTEYKKGQKIWNKNNINIPPRLKSEDESWLDKFLYNN